MDTLSTVLIALVSALHVWFLVLEMFLWKKPKGMKTFGTTPEFAEATAVLAANQGLYNGFLAAGLIWSLVTPSLALAYSLKIFFLACVVIAGIFGGITADKRIVLIQALPAAIALGLIAFF